MNLTIEIIVAPDGQARLETKGYAGAACRQASEFLERALGHVAAEQLTAEFHVQQTQAQNLQEDSR